MHQAAQGEVHTRRIEQCQGQRVGVFPVVEAVGDPIGGGRQIGAGEHTGQGGRGYAGAGQFVALLHHVRVRNVLLADAHFHRHGEVVHQRHQLFQQILTKRRRMGDGDAVGPW